MKYKLINQTSLIYLVSNRFKTKTYKKEEQQKTQNKQTNTHKHSKNGWKTHKQNHCK